jgi:hypothetical protein
VTDATQQRTSRLRLALPSIITCHHSFCKCGVNDNRISADTESSMYRQPHCLCKSVGRSLFTPLVLPILGLPCTHTEISRAWPAVDLLPPSFTRDLGHASPRAPMPIYLQSSRSDLQASRLRSLARSESLFSPSRNIRAGENKTQTPPSSSAQF